MELLNKNSRIIPWTFDPSDTKAWEEERFRILNSDGDIQRFGGSEISQVCGINNYNSAFHLFQIKLGRITPKKPNLLMINGNVLESSIIEYIKSYDLNSPDEETTAENFLNKTFIREIDKAEFFILSDDYPYLSISLDSVLRKGQPSLHDPNLLMPFDTFCEVKNVTYSSYKSWGDKVIPDYYMAQVQAGMMVTGAPYCYFCVFLDNRELIINKIDADEAWFNFIEEACSELSLRITKAKTIQTALETENDPSVREQLEQMLYDLEPNMDGLESTTDVIKDLYKDDDSEDELIGEEQEYAWADRYLQVNDELKELTTEKTFLKNSLLNFMKRARKMTALDITVTYKNGRFSVKRTKIDR